MRLKPILFTMAIALIAVAIAVRVPIIGALVYPAPVPPAANA